ncbi:MAG: SIMPL domain-containing protein [Candidatus Magasanikbacteria bacterium]
MPVKKTETTSGSKTLSSMTDMPAMDSMPTEKHDCCRGGHFGMMKHCKEHSCHFGRKLIMTFVGILIVYLIIFIGTLIRNEIKKYDYIGVADRQLYDKQISVTGEGSVEVKPNVSTVVVGTAIKAATSQEAMEKNDKLIADFVTKVKALGIPEADIKTESQSMYPEYNYATDGTSSLSGYSINQSVTVKVRNNVSLASKVVALSSEVGLNTIGGVTQSIDDKEVYIAEARQKAIKDAKVKAAQLSQMLGINLETILSYSEYVPGEYEGMYYDKAMLESSVGAGPTIETGTETVKLNITINYKIK